MTTNQLRISLALMVVCTSLAVCILVVCDVMPKDPSAAGTMGMVIGSLLAETKIILTRYFPSGDSEPAKPPENR